MHVCIWLSIWLTLYGEGFANQSVKKSLKLHVLFFCKCAEVCELRMRYRDLFERMFKTLRVFAPSSSEFIPFLAYHHSITDFEINAFLNQDSHRLLKFVSDLVSIFDTG